MAHLHNDIWGNLMCVSGNEPPLTLLKWGYRLLWVLLFISFMVVMGQWHTIITYTFLGSAVALLFPILFSRKVFEMRENVKCSWCGEMAPANSVNIIPDAYLDRDNEWHEGSICSPCNKERCVH